MKMVHHYLLSKKILIILFVNFDRDHLVQRA
jgi:hypothetical protein